MSVENILKKIYENVAHPAAFSSVYKLYKAAQNEDPSITQRQVIDWLNKNHAYTLHRRIVKKFYRRPVLVRGPQYQYQADLLFFKSLFHSNRGIRYLLTVIDCFSRFACIVGVKSKESAGVLEALKQAFEFMGYPKKLQTDKGGEFDSKLAIKFYEENNIIWFHTDQELKAQICERFNRTIREKLVKYMTAKKTFRYIDAIPDLIYAYNSSPHSSLGGKIAPKDVNMKNRNKVYDILYGDYLKAKKKKNRFSEGDTIRITRFRDKIEKKNLSNFSNKLFTVVQVLNTNPPTYRIYDPEDDFIIPGAFYEPQMQKFELKNNND